jgi:cytochrome c oxidase assembly protein subunit 15
MNSHSTHERQVAIWLLVCAATVFGMIVLGGVTRLTNSGLSIVEWQPLLGIFPPINETQWLEVFEKYKTFPEYRKINAGMSLAEFKFIFYFEYFHRLLGRLIGLIFLLPLVFFWLKGRISKPLLPKLLVMFVLGGLQGLLGWYMVKSGLIDIPRVSQYRLTAHLGLAVIIYAYILWIAFGLLLKGQASEIPQYKNIHRYSVAITIVIFIMILSGGFIAGTDAGFAYNTFPLMAGALIPNGLFALQPFWLNFFENILTIQFNHRVLAYLIFVMVCVFVALIFRTDVDRHIKFMSLVLLATLLIQLGLGIATLLYIVPLSTASLHQANAILLFTVSLYITHQLKYKSALP